MSKKKRLKRLSERESGERVRTEPTPLGKWESLEEVLNLRKTVNLLTSREREVLNLRKTGMTSQEIGDALGISYRTVKCHTWRIGQKMDAANTTHAVYLAVKTGIID